MESSDGVFVSSLMRAEFEADPDVPGTDVHVLHEGAGASVGLSRVAVAGDPIVWTIPSREVILVVEGAARIEITGGPTLQLGVGDIASLPAGPRRHGI